MAGSDFMLVPDQHGRYENPALPAAKNSLQVSWIRPQLDQRVRFALPAVGNPQLPVSIHQAVGAPLISMPTMTPTERMARYSPALPVAQPCTRLLRPFDREGPVTHGCGSGRRTFVADISAVPSSSAPCRRPNRAYRCVAMPLAERASPAANGNIYAMMSLQDALPALRPLRTAMRQEEEATAMEIRKTTYIFRRKVMARVPP